MAGPKQVAFRLGVDGSAEFKREFADAGASAQASLNQVGAAADAAAERVDRATARQQASWRRMADSAREAQAAAISQASFNQILSVGLAPSGSARDSAAVFEAHMREMDETAARANRLRAVIDPLSVAQLKFGAATKDADELLAKGAITAEEHAAAMKLAKGELTDAEKAAERLAGGAGLTTLQLNVLMGAARHTADALAAGISPTRILTMETLKAAPAMGGLGNLAKMAGGFIFSAGGAALGTAALFAIGAKAAWDYEQAFNSLANASTGFGARWNTTGEALEASAEAGSRAAHISVASAREMETGFLHAGTISAGVFEDLIGLSRKFALAMGEGPKDAAKELAKDFASGAEGARRLEAELGFLTEAEMRHLEVLAQQNDKTQFQQQLARDLNDHLAHTEQHVGYINNLLQEGTTLWSNFWAAAGKGIDGALTPEEQKSPEQQLKDRLPQRWLYDSGVLGPQNKASFDAYIADLQRQVAEERRRGAQPKLNQDASAAGDLAWADTGNAQKDALQAHLNTLQTGFRGITKPQVRAAAALDIQRYSEALKTWIPPEEKRLELMKLDSEMARTIDPAERRRLGALKEEITLKGEALTAEERRQQIALAGETSAGRLERRGERRAQTQAREIESMRASAAAALDVAEAYLKSASAGEVAEARRKALTEAVKKGADVEAYVAAQLQLNVGEAAANGAKTLAQLRDETAARKALNDQVAKGAMDAGDIAAQLKAEGAARLLVAAAAHAEGKAKAELLAIADALRKGEADATAEANRSAVLKSTSAASDQIALLQKELSLVSATNRERAVAIAQFKAMKELSDRHIDPNSAEGRARLEKATGQANASADLSAGKFAADTLRGQTEQLARLHAEAAAVGQSAEAQKEILDRLKLEQALRQDGVDLASKEAQQLLKNVQLVDEETRAYERQKAQIEAMRQTADGVVDTIGNALDPQNWRHWSDVGKQVLADLEKEFVKLALLNPLKNLINGNGALPTLGGFFGHGGGAGGFGFNWASLFGGGGGASPLPAAFQLPISLPGFASGTDSAPGGWAMVGEAGPEPMWVPRGAKIVNHASAEAAFRDALSGGGRGGLGSVTFDMRGAITTPELMDQVNQIAAAHAARGAHAAVKIAHRNAASWQARASAEKG